MSDTVPKDYQSPYLLNTVFSCSMQQHIRQLNWIIIIRGVFASIQPCTQWLYQKTHVNNFRWFSVHAQPHFQQRSTCSLLQCRLLFISIHPDGAIWRPSLTTTLLSSVQLALFLYLKFTYHYGSQIRLTLYVGATSNFIGIYMLISSSNEVLKKQVLRFLYFLFIDILISC